MTKIGPRDIQILTALDRCPLTVTQLLSLSSTFVSPFHDESNVRRRLRALAQAGFVKSWRYAFATDGQPPKYFKLSRDGYRLLYDDSVATPRRRYFEEIHHGHHPHTYALAETIVRIICCGHKKGIQLRHFARENSVRLEANGFTLYPDCAFQLVNEHGREFNFVIELDNGTERIRTAKDVESIERKIRGYDAHQQRFTSGDRSRYLVVFVTTRSAERLRHILDLAGMVMQNPDRMFFLGCSFQDLKESDPFTKAIFNDQRGLRRYLIPRVNPKKQELKNDPADANSSLKQLIG